MGDMFARKEYNFSSNSTVYFGLKNTLHNHSFSIIHPTVVNVPPRLASRSSTFDFLKKIYLKIPSKEARKRKLTNSKNGTGV